MYLIKCPGCKKEIDLTDKLPSLACDYEIYQCECTCSFSYGWYATAEIRRVIEFPVTQNKKREFKNKHREV